jgi:hypothetical protein
MADLAKEPARNAALAITDTLVRAMEDVGEREMVRCVILAMNEDGTERYIYSNARSEPEMFGMIAMASEGFTENIAEEDDQ